MAFRRVIWIVLDSVGIGEMPDAEAYGDAGSDTLGNIARAGAASAESVPAGLANIKPLTGRARPCARWRLRKAARSPRPARTRPPAIGRWRAFISKSRFRCFPHGFPPEVMDEFERRIGRSTLGNKAASGTEIIKELGEEHMRTGSPIVYTSADSVFQVAAHEEVIPLFELYKICETAREILRGPYEVGRVIARPFVGEPGAFHAHTEPPRLRGAAAQGHAARSARRSAECEVFGIGKIFDIFLGRGIREYEKTKNNADGMAKTLAAMERVGARPDFRQPGGFRSAVRASQRRGGLRARRWKKWTRGCRRFERKLREDDLAILTADHGCDPTTPSTDHSREYVPLLVYGKQARARRESGDCARRCRISARRWRRISARRSREGTSFLSQIL